MHRRTFLTATIGASALAAHRLQGEGGILALHRDGSHGAYSIQPGFTYALNDDVRTAASYV